MAFSMTGIGLSTIRKSKISLSVEIRTVNNRFLDISCKLPSLLVPFEQKIKDLVKTKLSRGKIHLSVSGEFNQEDSNLPIKVNSANVKAISDLLNHVIKDAKLDEKPGLDHFLNFSEIFEPVEKESFDEQLWEAVEAGVNDALEKLIEMRKQEGDALASELVKRIGLIEDNINQIENLAKNNSKDAFEKMKERIESLIANVDLDENRLYTEIAIIADKLDVTEECVRMKSHLDLFVDTLENSPYVGKKLNFLLQEMHREVNTIGSKASNFKINHLVVDLKEQIEVMREQVQNLE